MKNIKPSSISTQTGSAKFKKAVELIKREDSKGRKAVCISPKLLDGEDVNSLLSMGFAMELTTMSNTHEEAWYIRW